MDTFKTLLGGLRHEEEGQGLVETGLIYTLVSIVAIAALASLGGELQSLFQSIGDVLSGVG